MAQQWRRGIPFPPFVAVALVDAASGMIGQYAAQMGEVGYEVIVKDDFGQRGRVEMVPVVVHEAVQHIEAFLRPERQRQASVMGVVVRVVVPTSAAAVMDIHMEVPGLHPAWRDSRVDVALGQVE